MASELKGKAVGVTPRPRVALVGLEDDENKALQKYFATTHVLSHLYRLPHEVSGSELDLIISAADASDENVQNIDELYRDCHLILLGSNAWMLNSGPWMETGRYVCGETARSNGYEISATLDPRMENALRIALPKSALGAQTISWRSNNRGKDPNDQSCWMAWASEPRRPLAINVFRGKMQSGLAWFTTRPGAASVSLIKAICAEWAQKHREAFPTIVEWVDSPEWMTAEEQTVAEAQRKLLEEFESVRRGFSTRLEDIQRRAGAAKAAAEAGPRGLLTCQDERLVAAVKGVLEDLGFAVEDVDESRRKNDPNAPKREDLQLRIPTDSSWLAVVEVKGHKRRGANAEDLTQIERHVKMFLKAEKRDPSLKIYIANSQFALPPSERQPPYAGDPLLASTFCNEDPDTPGLIVPTPDLFRLHRDRGVLGQEEARRLLTESRGVFAYPLKPKG